MDILGAIEPFVGPTGDAARVFPAIAVAASFPFAALHYRRWGRIHPWRAAAIYSFAFYLIAALFLVLLPLPELPARGADPAAWEARFGRLRSPELDPTAFLRDIVRAEPGTMRARAVFQALFNLALLAPLGAYLRWLFKARAPAAAGIGFLVSLFFETCQLTGIFWIYPGPFRLFDAGDLVLNTLGCLAGAAAAAPLADRGFLPDLSAPPRPAGERIGPLRRSLAFGIDFLAFAASTLFVVVLVDLLGPGSRVERQAVPAALFLAFFAVLPAAAKGRSLGKALMLCAIVRRDGREAGALRIAARQALLWAPPALAWLLDAWFRGQAMSPTPLGWAFASWCLAWAVNAASALPSRERASFLDKALGLRVRNSWKAPRAE
jgi:ADP-dependent NAD(P)H-hydrate dehydratase / NAD(P)H-hydrate epimerase